MASTNSSDLNFGVAPAPASFSMDESMQNLLPDFDINAMHQTVDGSHTPFSNLDIENVQPTLDLSYNPYSLAAPAPGAATSPALNSRQNHYLFPGCNKVSKRVSDRKRHEDSVHLSVPGTFLCTITGCPNSRGKGCKRADKFTEHLWKKHTNLGYTKT